MAGGSGNTVPAPRPVLGSPSPSRCGGRRRRQRRRGCSGRWRRSGSSGRPPTGGRRRPRLPSPRRRRRAPRCGGASPPPSRRAGEATPGGHVGDAAHVCVIWSPDGQREVVPKHTIIWSLADPPPGVGGEVFRVTDWNNHTRTGMHDAHAQTHRHIRGGGDLNGKNGNSGRKILPGFFLPF